MKQYTDVSFPRGGTKKRKRNSKQSKDDLFTIPNDNDVPKQKKKKMKENVDAEDEGTTVVVENPSFQLYGSGFTVLGCIREMKDTSVTVELPGGLYGSIPVTGVSKVYTNLLKKSLNNPEVDAPPMQDIFYIGQLVVCSVTSASEDAAKVKKNISLSTDPEKINSGISSSLLRHGMVLPAVVVDVEDHGYVMNLGITGIKAFLKNEQCTGSHFIEANQSLKVGQVLQCMINKPDKNPGARITSRIVDLTIIPANMKKAIMKANMNVNMHALVPGMLIQGNVSKVIKSGLIGSSLGYDSCIPSIYFKSSTENSRSYSIDEQICGRLLYIHPIMKTLYISLNVNVVKKAVISPQQIFSDYEIGSNANAEVVSCAKKGVYLKLNDNIPAFCKLKELSNEMVDDISKDFAVGTVHKCRIIGFQMLTSSLFVTMKQSSLEQEIFSKNDIVIGQSYKCKVMKLVKAGLAVSLAPKLSAFIPSMHLSDVHLTHPEKHFKVGQKLTCRVLTKHDDGKIILTNKSSLVKTKHELITSFDSVTRGIISDGFIINIQKSHVLVSFYNNVVGIVFSKNMAVEKVDDATKVFQRGQVVRCQVLNVDKQDEKMSLSFKIQENIAVNAKANAQMGKIVSVKVVGKTHDGLDVVILPEETPAIVPISHLSDLLHLCPLLYQTYEIGSEHKALLFHKQRVNIVSMKQSLMEFASNNSYIDQLAKLHEGMLVTGLVENKTNYGMFVRLSHKLSGLVPLKNLEVVDLEDNEANNSYKLNQAVVAKVMNIEQERERVTLSLKMRHVYSGDTSSSLDLLSSYVNDSHSILNHYSSSDQENQENLSKLYIGCIVNIKVSKMMKSGFTGIANAATPCICTSEHYGDLEMKEGDELCGAVVFVNLEDCSVQVTVNQAIVERIKKFRNNWHSKVSIGQKMKCDVIYTNDDYVLVMLHGHAYGKLAFLPNKRHLNDNIGRLSLFTLFNAYPVIVRRIVNENVLVTLDPHSRCKSINKSLKSKAEPESPSRRKRSRSDSVCSDISDIVSEPVIKKHDLELGQIYNAIVKTVKSVQANILVKGKIPGRIHVSEVADDVVEGENPLSKFKIGQKLKVKVIGFREVKTKSFLPISHHTFKRAIPECSIRKSVLENNAYQCQDENEPVPVEQENDSAPEVEEVTIGAKGIGESSGFVWDSNLSAISSLTAGHVSSSDSENDQEETVKKRKRRTARMEREEELNLRQKEIELLGNNESIPKDADAFDRAVLSSPDSSIIWLQYMAFHLGQAEIDKARNVAERALKTISFREEQEKFNVWMSLLNLENLYGTSDSLKDVLQRAIQHCDPLTVYNKLINIYVTSDKLKDAESLHNVLIKKFHGVKQVWIDFGQFLMKNKQAEKAQSIMQRALKCLEKRDHLDVLSKFAQYEMSLGDVERGKTMFDNILSSYPKRTDLWSIYIDVLINAGDISVVRKVLDKAINLKLPAKKMKFFFKRYIALEEKYGTAEAVEAIKEKVMNFVET